MIKSIPLLNQGVNLKQFSEMNLKQGLVEALKRMNFITATEVQEQAIPVALEGKDLIVRAKTGTGKTCAFMVPIMQREVASRDPEVLIIVPTRELAIQIYDVATKLRHERRESVAIVYGGASINIQMQNLRRNPDIIIGTPGRIIDLYERRALRLDAIKFLVLDEADIMFDMGFIEDIELILSKTPEKKQTMIFSATMPQKIISVAKRHMRFPVHISVGSEEEIVATKISHFYSIAEYNRKFATLLAYVEKYEPKKAIIFVATQHAASMVHAAFSAQGFNAMLIHGGLSQPRREREMMEFKKRGRFLIATNVAARGIDISGISDIINFDVPEDPRVYVHRVGRSARMDADGRAFSIITHDQKNLIWNIEEETNTRMNEIQLDVDKFAHIKVFGGRSFDTEQRGGFHRGRGGFHGRREGGSGRGFRHGGFNRDREREGGSEGGRREFQRRRRRF